MFCTKWNSIFHPLPSSPNVASIHLCSQLWIPLLFMFFNFPKPFFRWINSNEYGNSYTSTSFFNGQLDELRPHIFFSLLYPLCLFFRSFVRIYGLLNPTFKSSLFFLALAYVFFFSLSLTLFSVCARVRVCDCYMIYVLSERYVLKRSIYEGKWNGTKLRNGLSEPNKNILAKERGQRKRKKTTYFRTLKIYYKIYNGKSGSKLLQEERLIFGSNYHAKTYWTKHHERKISLICWTARPKNKSS